MNDIKPGDSITIKKEITSELIDRFAMLSGDFNQVHMDNTYCSEHGYKTRIAHGMLVLSYLSYLIGMLLPGNGSIWLSQDIDFILPVYAGDSVTITGTVTEKVNSPVFSSDMIKMKILIKNQSDLVVTRGYVKVMVK